MQVQEKFSYSAQPHAAPTKTKPKYRDENQQQQQQQLSGLNVDSQNIMYDARVVRGNTYSAKVLSSSLKSEIDKSNAPRKFPRKDNRSRAYGGQRRSSTPPPMEGRSHMVMQTEDFLEELTDRPIEQDAEVQTQPFMDRPASPLFVRAKIGFDVQTQVETGELFDFNTEVEPILEVLVGKTLHVAMLEVMQEEELEAIRLQQEEFETIRNVELAEAQHLEAEMKRKMLEKERRLAQEKKRLEDRRRLEETIAARQFSAQFLGELHINVFGMLEEQGHFYDPVKKEIEENFLGELTLGMTEGAERYEAASLLALELLQQARKMAMAYEVEIMKLKKLEEERRKAEELERQRLAKEEAERMARLLAESAEDTKEGGNNAMPEDD